MSDSETAELCRRIYRKHQRALDLIFEHRPDHQAAIRDVLVERIGQTVGLSLDRAGKTRIDFVPDAWDLPILRQGAGGTAAGRMLLFQFSNESKRLGLVLWIGPGPAEIRQRLYDRGQHPPFQSTGRRIGAKWNSLWSRIFLQATAYEAEDMADLIALIDMQWTKFVEHDLPALVDAILKSGSEVPTNCRESTLPPMACHQRTGFCLSACKSRSAILLWRCDTVRFQQAGDAHRILGAPEYAPDLTVAPFSQFFVHCSADSARLLNKTRARVHQAIRWAPRTVGRLLTSNVEPTTSRGDADPIVQQGLGLPWIPIYSPELGGPGRGRSCDMRRN